MYYTLVGYLEINFKMESISCQVVTTYALATASEKPLFGSNFPTNKGGSVQYPPGVNCLSQHCGEAGIILYLRK